MCDTILDILTNKELQKLCERYFSNNDLNNHYNIVKCELKNISDAPSGFLATHKILELWLEIKRPNVKNVGQNIRFFLKSTPKNAIQKEYMDQFEVFAKERKVYNTIIPHLQKFCSPDNKDFSPKCYLAKTDLLVFEDLSSKGYRLATRIDSTLDYEHLICVLRALANQHAASIAFEESTGKPILDFYGEYLSENSYPSDVNHIRSIVFITASDVLCEFVKLIPKYRDSPDIKEILLKFREALAQIFVLCQPSMKYRNVFSHGDLWANNIMFRYATEIDGSEDSNKPVESRLVDYQLARYSPPILDVITILTISTSSDFRKKHLTNLLKIYYNSLRDHLGVQGIDIVDVLPEIEFWASVDDYKIAGLIESCLFSHLTILPTDVTREMISDADKFNEFLNTQRIKVCLQAFQTNKIYRERLSDMVSEIIDNYVI